MHLYIRKAIEIVNYLLATNHLDDDAKERLIELKELLFSLKDDLIKLRVEISEIQESIETLNRIIQPSLQNLEKTPLIKVVIPQETKL